MDKKRIGIVLLVTTTVLGLLLVIVAPTFGPAQAAAPGVTLQGVTFRESLTWEGTTLRHTVRVEAPANLLNRKVVVLRDYYYEGNQSGGASSLRANPVATLPLTRTLTVWESSFTYGCDQYRLNRIFAVRDSSQGASGEARSEQAFKGKVPCTTPTPVPQENFDALIAENIAAQMREGRETFRHDTFGDEAFWGDTLQLHRAIEGEALGGVGPGVSPKTALAVGLKVDMDALPAPLVAQIKQGKVDLDNPATTLALLKLDSVVGVKGFFNADGSLGSMGITCALCHSTVDNAFTYGIGHRLDGWANHDLNVGAIVSLAPNLQPVADLLSTDVGTVKAVLGSWGPGKYDAELLLDGKAFNPQQVTDGKTTGTNVSGATLIPDAFGLAGHNLHTWTGAWGSVTYWNAFVANTQMHGKGTFFDPRLDDATKYPIAAAHKFGHIQTPPDEDRITSKLPALQVYQLAIPSPKPQAGVHYDAAAAERGDAIFEASCNRCHVEPIWTEPGWNLHPASDIGIDSFQADRAPDNRYRTAKLAGLFVREEGIAMNPANKGRFYHDGRFATLLDVVKHYNTFFNLGLSDEQMNDVVEYLKSL